MLALQSSIIHLVTHSIIDSHDSLWFFLMLAPSGTDSKLDGRLEVLAIRRLRLDADLATTATSKTARHSIDDHRLMSGIGQTFLETGCRSASFNHRKIDSRRMAEFVTRNVQLSQLRGLSGSWW
ncbi:MAG: CHAT domain-containing protein [Acidobacteria bacterium]|nr:CHAT domain-containing protein [Acidobacteriota bacterium]